MGRIARKTRSRLENLIAWGLAGTVLVGFLILVYWAGKGVGAW